MNKINGAICLKTIVDHLLREILQWLKQMRTVHQAEIERRLYTSDD